IPGSRRAALRQRPDFTGDHSEPTKHLSMVKKATLKYPTIGKPDGRPCIIPAAKQKSCIFPAILSLFMKFSIYMRAWTVTG
ncbi:hypothetical protein, partial [Pantoea eucalypti]|uniref:hypothetical protein n=1 Tax=Pantoea eucalypti TaxID=470933 RepID=UPI0028A2A515